MPNELTEFDLEQLCEYATQAALEAGDYISSFDRSALNAEYKSAGSTPASQVVTEVDRHCDQLIQDLLPLNHNGLDIAILSEESADNHNQHTKNRFNCPYFWCVDPLDGTLPFTKGKPGYAVSIALVSHTGEPVIGIIYDPSKKDLYSAVNGKGAKRNKERINLDSSNKLNNATELLVYADLSFTVGANYPGIKANLENIAKQLGAKNHKEIYGNGAAMNACALLQSPLACYFKYPKSMPGGGSVWDFSASACIVKEAGGWVSNFNGEPLELNSSESTFMNHQGVVYASNKQLAQTILATRRHCA